MKRLRKYTLIVITVLFSVVVISLSLKLYFQPTVVIIPHHNLVADTRANLLKVIKSKRLITHHIIIIGPDHFGNNQRQITYADNDWELSNGNLLADQEVISKISSTFNKDNNLVKSDHAIYNLLPQIKSNWPSAQITSILIGQKTDFAQLDNLINNINAVCKSDCLLIASVDFSHYLPATLADIHDQTSISALSTLNLEKIKKLEVDSPQSLFVAASHAQFITQNHFTLFAHTNSGFLTRHPDIETTTHVFGYYQPSLLPLPASNVTTFTYLPAKFESIENQSTVGERFFYGVDDFKVDPSVPPNFVVAGYKTGNLLKVVYLPVTISGHQLNFDRGAFKAKKIKDLFDSIHLPYSTKDYDWSTITYDIGKS